VGVVELTRSGRAVGSGTDLFGEHDVELGLYDSVAIIALNPTSFTTAFSRRGPITERGCAGLPRLGLVEHLTEGDVGAAVRAHSTELARPTSPGSLRGVNRLVCQDAGMRYGETLPEADDLQWPRSFVLCDRSCRRLGADPYHRAEL